MDGSIHCYALWNFDSNNISNHRREGVSMISTLAISLSAEQVSVIRLLVDDVVESRLSVYQVLVVQLSMNCMLTLRLYIRQRFDNRILVQQELAVYPLKKNQKLWLLFWKKQMVSPLVEPAELLEQNMIVVYATQWNHTLHEVYD